MEKLIMLLKESGKADEICPTGIDIRKQYFDEENITRADRMMYEYLCSKHFGFIQRLLENDKIDRKKLSYKNLYMSDYGSSDDIFLAYDKGEQGIIYAVDYYESLLMLLSISDTPIEDLILYLK